MYRRRAWSGLSSEELSGLKVGNLTKGKMDMRWLTIYGLVLKPTGIGGDSEVKSFFLGGGAYLKASQFENN